jgi:zinc transport system ATP-binding protein
MAHSDNSIKYLVEIQNLRAGYGENIVLEDINLRIRENDYVGLIGPNGGGKTTLLKVILGLVQPRQGTVRVMGQSPKQGRRHIGYVPQLAVLDWDFPISVWDIVRMGRLNNNHLLRRFTDQDDAIVTESLQAVDILDLKNRGLNELSGGQRQRVYIARALATEPALLLLDEPTASVDMEAQSHIYELLNQINDWVTILLISHDMNVVSRYVKTIGCLNRHLHYHREKQITPEMLQAGYHCPVDLIAHGIPHRVLATHESDPKP